MTKFSCPNCQSANTQNILESTLRGFIVLTFLAGFSLLLYWLFSLILFIAALLYMLYGLKQGRHSWFCKECKHIWTLENKNDK